MGKSGTRNGSERHFTDLKVWRKAHQLFLDVAEDIDSLPKKRSAWILSDQILRSAGSITANLSEGFNQSARKFSHCINIAIGEANETENWLYKLRDCKLLGTDRVKNHLQSIIEIRKMLIGLKRAVRNNDSKIKEMEEIYRAEA